MLNQATIAPLAALLFLSVAVASAQEQDRLDFKGVKLGSSRNEFLTKFPFMECAERKTVVSDFSCIGAGERQCRAEDEGCLGNYTYAGVPTRFVAADFIGNELVAVTVSFDPRYFDQISSALAKRYGPAVQEVAPAVTQAGVTYENDKRTWKRADTFLRLRKYLGRSDQGVAVYQLASGVAEFERREGELAKRGAGDL